ncbi:MAG: hypothetical protein IJH77_02995 [Mogibacterium sp.]|nr:hypothetical protein [Mogibacterium sp.]
MSGKSRKGRHLGSAAEPVPPEVAEYIRTVRLRRRIFGIQESEIWALVSEIQRYYQGGGDIRETAGE